MTSKKGNSITRALAVALFTATGNKQPVNGVGIRETTKLLYDPVLALEYAQEHGVALKLDIAAFEQMAKIKELRPGFVTVLLTATATISQDLSKILEER